MCPSLDQLIWHCETMLWAETLMLWNVPQGWLASRGRLWQLSYPLKRGRLAVKPDNGSASNNASETKGQVSAKKKACPVAGIGLQLIVCESISPQPAKWGAGSKYVWDSFFLQTKRPNKECALRANPPKKNTGTRTSQTEHLLKRFVAAYFTFSPSLTKTWRSSFWGNNTAHNVWPSELKSEYLF